MMRKACPPRDPMAVGRRALAQGTRGAAELELPQGVYAEPHPASHKRGRLQKGCRTRPSL